MAHRYLTFRNLVDLDGRTIPYHVQILSYLIWSAPERGLTMRDYRNIFRRVGAFYGYRIGLWAAVKFTRQTPRAGWATRSWLRGDYYLNDLQMDKRQGAVFEDRLRGTGFDKMDRIRRRAYDGVPYAKMGPETCDRDSLFGELRSVDVSVIRDWDGPRAGSTTRTVYA